MKSGWRNLRTVLWLISFAGAFAVTHTPPSAMPRGRYPIDTLLHFTGYFLLGAATIWRKGPRAGARRASKLARVYACLLAYALFDELTQELVGRSFEWSDFFADAAGAVAGILVAAIWYRWRATRTRAA